MATFAGAISSQGPAAGTGSAEFRPSSTASAGRTVHAAVPLAGAVEAGRDPKPQATNPCAEAEPANVANPVPPPIVAPRAFVLLFLCVFRLRRPSRQGAARHRRLRTTLRKPNPTRNVIIPVLPPGAAQCGRACSPVASFIFNWRSANQIATAFTAVMAPTAPKISTSCWCSAVHSRPTHGS